MAHASSVEQGERAKPAREIFYWLETGAIALKEMLAAIGEARKSIRLEVYIFQPGPLGEEFRTALVRAARRGVQVQVLTDAYGSSGLAEDFWRNLRMAGGDCRRFTLPGIGRFGLRDHRKLMICDQAVAFVTGSNIGPEYDGDGVKSGWRDLGLHIKGKLAGKLAQAFDEMFALAGFEHPRFAWLRHAVRQHRISTAQGEALLSAPGWRDHTMVPALLEDFSQAHTIRIICAYFLPTRRVWKALVQAARRGARIQLVLAGKTDVPLMRMAAQGLYRKLLQAGVEIFEYQPQILHAKMILVDEWVVYAGSANLDIRSLRLNYELLIRVENRRLAEEGAALFTHDLAHCRRVQLQSWVRQRCWWHRWQARVAFFLLTKLDPFLASDSWRR
jgi:cardiolipin synthase A/B